MKNSTLPAEYLTNFMMAHPTDWAQELEKNGGAHRALIAFDQVHIGRRDVEAARKLCLSKTELCSQTLHAWTNDEFLFHVGNLLQHLQTLHSKIYITNNETQ